MSKIALGLGGFFILVGLGLAISPETLAGAVDWTSRTGLNAAAGIRIMVGLLLLVAAPATRYPTVFRFLGGLTLIVGLLLPFLPLEVWAEFFGYFFGEGLPVYRVVGSLGAVALGSFFIHAGRPKHPQP